MAQSAISQTTIASLKSLDPDPAFLDDLIDTYLSISQPALKKLETHFHAREPEATSQVAHALKSSSANLGALTLADLLDDLEGQCAKVGFSFSDSTLREIKTEFERAVGELKALHSPR